jgi:hypothetical protein
MIEAESRQMDEIPDDVMKAARAAIVPGERLQFTTDGLARIAARAILAERERCAKVAERDADWTAFSRQPRKDWKTGDETNVFAAPDDEQLPTPAGVFGYTNGIAAGRAIAAVIRSGAH